MVTPQDFSKVSFKPKRYHGYNVLLFILGSLFPPLAVAARFGIGSDFFINLFLTICGYIPGHVHNFYIQNIRNNKNHRRTPKWAQRYGLVDTTTIKRHEKRSQWASRYTERNPHSTLEDQQYEAGEIPGGSSTNISYEGGPLRPQPTGEFWSPTEEHYYNNRNDSGSVQSSSSRWRYPANFEDTINAEPLKKKKIKKDRHARTEDAHSMSDAPVRRKKKKRSTRNAPVDDYVSTYSRSSTIDGPENPEGGAYDGRSNGYDEPQRGNTHTAMNDDDILRQEL